MFYVQGSAEQLYKRTSRVTRVLYRAPTEDSIYEGEYAIIVESMDPCGRKHTQDDAVGSLHADLIRGSY